VGTDLDEQPQRQPGYDSRGRRAAPEQILDGEHFKTLNTGNGPATGYRAAERTSQAITLAGRDFRGRGSGLPQSIPN
jgi:hypothetical protein